MYETLDDKTYNYDYGMTREKFLKAMRTNDASDLFVYGDNYCTIRDPDTGEDTGDSSFRGLFVFEFGYVDIELCLCGEYDKEAKTIRPIIYYDTCVKRGDDIWSWECDYYLDSILPEEETKCNVDFNAENWDEQMEKDMKDKFFAYCKAMKYNYLHPITY